MPEINIHEYVKRKLDFEAKLTLNDIERVWDDFHVVMGILRSSKMDRQRIMGFSMLSTVNKNKKVAGFGDLDLSKQRYLLEISMQTAEYVAARKIRAAQNTTVKNGQWRTIKTR